MANTIVSPNMNLPVPVPGVDPGPDYANNLNSSLNIIDGHNHTVGSGVQIPPAGLDINSDLTFQGNSPTNVYSVEFSNSASTSAILTLYTAPSPGGGIDDLFYNDAAGNVIQLTKAGTVNATIASLPGQSYAAGTFVWKQGAGSTTPANFDIGSITIRPNTASTTNGITVSPPSAIASAYDLVLPALPGSTLFMTLDSSGNISTAADIQPTQIASGSIQGSLIAAATVSQSNLVAKTFNISNGIAAAGQIAQSPSSGTTGITATSFAAVGSSTTATITIGSPAIVSTTIVSPVAITNGVPVIFSTTGALPTGITAGTMYFIVNLSGGSVGAVTYNVATTIGGSPITTSGTQSGTHTVKTVCAVTLTTVGGAVQIMITGDNVSPGGMSQKSFITIQGTSGATVYQGNLLLTRVDGGYHFNTYILAVTGTSDGSIGVQPTQIWLDNSAAGTYTYYLQAECNAVDASFVFNNISLVAWEL